MPDSSKVSVLLVEHGSENLGWIEEHLLGLDVNLFWASSTSYVYTVTILEGGLVLG